MQKLAKDVLTYSTFLSGGEYVAQMMNNPPNKSGNSPGILGPVDMDIIKNTAMWSIGGGAAVSLWYTYLDSPRFKNSALVKKTLMTGAINSRFGVPNRLLAGKAIVDILFDAPLYGSYVLFKSHAENKQMSFWNMYKTDIVFWLPVNMANFFLVPPKYRVPVVSASTCVWAILLPMVSGGAGH